jgi:uncharacterized protein with ParB-like and HNH nuclease domain
MDEIKLETKLVGEINGKFFVPSYQRGYRWGEEEVLRLLDDVYSIGEDTTKNYCIQPIVVRVRDDGAFELIDGQQRLTTIFLIYKYMHISSGGFIDDAKFTLEYETRKKSADFLDKIDMDRMDENIDFFYICKAYTTIGDWFTRKEKKSVITNINKYFDERVSVIWYEVRNDEQKERNDEYEAESKEDSIGLFTRLNIGKIPLTSAELIKALFLSRDTATMDRKKQEEISLQWDNIEKELHDDSLWYFLTNNSGDSYQTRIDLVLDLKAGRQDADAWQKYLTFFKFDEMRKTQSLEELWSEIQKTFLTLKDWYENHELYHKIGYLIASNHTTLASLYAMSIGKSKHDFKAMLDTLIKESIDIDDNYGDLSYDKADEAKEIGRLLLLFNVESVRRNGAQTQWFPFNKLKFTNSGKTTWSLEHIHAQHSDGMQKRSEWKEWLGLHLPSVKAIGAKAELITAMENAQKKELDKSEFERLQQQVVELLSSTGNTEYLHSISNLALLNVEDNAALNNSTFDVKRNRIIEMDKQGQYIPFCTRMVFFKYYTPSESNQLHFWGQADRRAYIDNINDVLKNYLKEKIIIDKEEA